MGVREPWPYQHDAIQRGVRTNQYYALDCGLGKSLTAVETVKRLRWKNELYKFALIVVSPKASLPQWRQEIIVQDPQAPAYFLEDIPDNRDLIDEHVPGYIVCYYEQLPKISELLWAFNFLVIIADEAHFINNRNTARTESLKKLRAFRKIAMSATPMQASVADLWSVLNWMDPQQFSSYWQFVDEFCVQQPGYRGNVVVGTKPDKKQELGNLLRPLIFQRSKAEVAPDLPPLISTRIPIVLEEDQQKLYEHIRKAKDIEVDMSEYWDGIVEDADKYMLVKNGLSRIVRLQQVLSYPGIIGATGVVSTKMAWVQAYIANNPSEQIVVFSRFRKTALELYRQASQDKLASALVVGGKSFGVDEFRSGKRKVMFGTIAAMGTALDLPMAKTVIFIEADWSSVKMYQATQRVHRINITEPKHLIYLEATGSVDEMVRECLEQKWSTISLVYNFMKAEGDISE